MTTVISCERAVKFRTAVDEILKTKDLLSFPYQIIFKGHGQLFFFFEGSLQGYKACI